MRRLLCPTFPLFLFLLSGCAHLGNLDYDAVEGQAIESHTVKIEAHVIIDISRLQLPVGSADVGWAGSGSTVAVNSVRGESLVLTAKHVCHVPTEIDTHFIGTFAVMSSLLTVQTAEGVLMFAEPLVEDINSDVCVIRVFGEAGTPARVANGMPPRQAKVVAAGAPHGVMEPNMVPETDGRYGGYTYVSLTSIAAAGIPIDATTDRYWRVNLFTFAGAPGSSGGGIYYHGRLVSLVSMGDRTFPHLIYGMPLDHIQSVVRSAIELWH